MGKICRKLLFSAVVLGASATPYLGLATAHAEPPRGTCTTCALYMLDLCWIVISSVPC
jgi:hypothetical protein